MSRPLTKVYLVRHAHAHWQPSEERPLSQKGRAAAEALARFLGEAPITAIYSSPARRAFQTIQPLASALGLRPEIVADLRERELVVPVGTRFEDAVEAAWRHPDLASEGSESNRVGAARGARALRQAVASHPGETIALSTHGNLLALTLNALDPAYGYPTWRSLTFPDVYELSLRDGAPATIRRGWRGPPPESSGSEDG